MAPRIHSLSKTCTVFPPPMFFPSLSLRALGAFVLLAAPTLADTAAALSPDASSFSSRDSSSIPGPGPPCDPLVNNAQCRYDYIIIGGGTAGLVVAARLSEDPGVTVAVIEAGSSAKGDDRIDIPSNIGTPFGSELDWQVNTVPQIFSNNNQFYWPRGKVLGGCSALNFMVWDRASKTEYDAWEQLGNPGWNWNSISST